MITIGINLNDNLNVSSFFWWNLIIRKIIEARNNMNEKESWRFIIKDFSCLEYSIDFIDKKKKNATFKRGILLYFIACPKCFSASVAAKLVTWTSSKMVMLGKFTDSSNIFFSLHFNYGKISSFCWFKLILLFSRMRGGWEILYWTIKLLNTRYYLFVILLVKEINGFEYLMF